MFGCFFDLLLVYYWLFFGDVQQMQHLARKKTELSVSQANVNTLLMVLYKKKKKHSPEKEPRF